MTAMRRAALTLLLALAALAAPSAALASSADVIKDCQDGKIDGSYSQSEFASALRNIPTDVDEYTDCRDVIRRARLGAAGSGAKSRTSQPGGTVAGGGGGGGAAGGGTAGGGATSAPDAGGSAKQLIASATPAEKAAVAQAQGADAAAVDVGGQRVSPDRAGLSPAGAANVVPTPLVVALVLLGLALALGGVQTVRSRVLARRTAAP